jgi:ribonuclease J
MLGYLQNLGKLMSFEDGLLVYSMWNGYKSKSETSRFIDECKRMGLQTIDLHTSGHADPATIQALIDKTNPTDIIPIHTENAKWFENKAKK